MRMASSISITTSNDLQAKAASLLSQYLDDELKCPHAYLGGFAWSLLGNKRPTEISPESPGTAAEAYLFCFFHDIDVLIETKNLDVPKLRQKLESMDERFASAGIKFYFIHVSNCSSPS
jgi:hypothetical protein